ncbi:MAG: glycosyltransferase family 39 protein [Frankiales bacterium]|nr:glycosyltransferase family 39 protein [Frankiales bacterium]
MLVWLAVAGLVVGLIAGVTSGPLWLDETLSVNIATLPLSQVPGALRVDGAPPLYYLLLHAWAAAFGTGAWAVRLLTVTLTPIALLLAHRLGRRLGGVATGRAAVIVLASLPWTMRFFSETRMYGLVVVLVLAGALALLRVREAASRGRTAALAVLVTALLLTHYWSLFLLAAVGLWHLPGALRRRTPDLQVVSALLLGGVLFTPWLPTFVFQALHTGAPWARPPGLVALVQTPTFWGGGVFGGRVVLAVLLVGLAVAGAMRVRAARVLALVALATLLLAWGQTATLGGAYTGRYTAVAVPLVAAAAAVGASRSGRAGIVALVMLATVGVGTGVPAAAASRTAAAGIAAAVRSAAGPGAVVAYCPDQLAPAVQRLLGPGYRGVVYPTLGPPERVDWVDYAARQDAADPRAIARRLDTLAGSRELLVLKASGFRTFGRQCEALLAELINVRGPATLLFGKAGTTDQLLYAF